MHTYINIYVYIYISTQLRMLDTHRACFSRTIFHVCVTHETILHIYAHIHIILASNAPYAHWKIPQIYVNI